MITISVFIGCDCSVLIGDDCGFGDFYSWLSRVYVLSVVCLFVISLCFSIRERPVWREIVILAFGRIYVLRGSVIRLGCLVF